MKRQIFTLKKHEYSCCDGANLCRYHSQNNRTSARARALDKKREHKHARSILKQQIHSEANQ